MSEQQDNMCEKNDSRLYLTKSEDLLNGRMVYSKDSNGQGQSNLKPYSDLQLQYSNFEDRRPKVGIDHPMKLENCTTEAGRFTVTKWQLDGYFQTSRNSKEIEEQSIWTKEIEEQSTSTPFGGLPPHILLNNILDLENDPISVYRFLTCNKSDSKFRKNLLLSAVVFRTLVQPKLSPKHLVLLDQEFRETMFHPENEDKLRIAQLDLNKCTKLQAASIIRDWRTFQSEGKYELHTIFTNVKGGELWRDPSILTGGLNPTDFPKYAKYFLEKVYVRRDRNQVASEIIEKECQKDCYRNGIPLLLKSTRDKIRNRMFTEHLFVNSPDSKSEPVKTGTFSFDQITKRDVAPILAHSIKIKEMTEKEREKLEDFGVTWDGQLETREDFFTSLQANFQMRKEIDKLMQRINPLQMKCGIVFIFDETDLDRCLWAEIINRLRSGFLSEILFVVVSTNYTVQAPNLLSSNELIQAIATRCISFFMNEKFLQEQRSKMLKMKKKRRIDEMAKPLDVLEQPERQLDEIEETMDVDQPERQLDEIEETLEVGEQPKRLRLNSQTASPLLSPPIDYRVPPFLSMQEILNMYGHEMLLDENPLGMMQETMNHVHAEEILSGPPFLTK